MAKSVDRDRRITNRGLGIFLLSCVAVAVANCASRPQPVETETTATPLPPVSDSGRDLTADQQVLQALNRLTFGPRPGDVTRVRQMGVDRWIAEQLSPERIPDRETERYVARFPSYSQPINTLQVQYPSRMKVLNARRNIAPGQPAVPMTRDDSVAVQTAERAAGRLVADIQMLRVGRALITDRQLQEVMVDFWENHFTVYDRKGQQMRYYLAAYDREAIRPYALGKFRDLLGAVAHSPAMLFYLDNWESVADSTEPTLVARPIRRFPQSGPRRFAANVNPAAPPVPRRPARGLNENYGRELLELHTLGVDGGYTQQDVINVARALTGWSIERPQEIRDGDAGFVFRPAFHDAGSKVVLGHALPPGRGTEDGEDVLDIVARHPSTARFIATKLCRRFVSDSPSPALVAKAAATFTRSNGDIRQVLWTILTSPEFFSRAAYRTKVKSPFEVVVSALRAVNAEPDTTPRTTQLIARMGEPIFGHQAPNGYPETGESWMNTGAILNRINFGLTVAANRVSGASLDHWPAAPALMAAPRGEQVDAVINEILGGSVSPDTRAILMSGDHPLLATMKSTSPADDPRAATADDDASVSEQAPGGGAASGAAMSEPANDDMMEARRRRGARQDFRPLPPLQGLAQVVGLALGAPEFQRR
jgi:uncharacterized protein (DUF1800 family)